MMDAKILEAISSFDFKFSFNLAASFLISLKTCKIIVLKAMNCQITPVLILL